LLPQHACANSSMVAMPFHWCFPTVSDRTRSLGAAASGAPAPSSQQRKRGKPQDLAGGITCKFCRKKPCRFGPRCPAPAAGEPTASHPVPAEPGPAQAVPAEPVTAPVSVTSFGPSAPMDIKQVFRRQDSNVRTACARWGAPASCPIQFLASWPESSHSDRGRLRV
jgi:hypothetical protein